MPRSFPIENAIRQFPVSRQRSFPVPDVPNSGVVTTGAIIPSGDMQSGTDRLILSGDMQSGSDAELYVEGA